MVGAHAGRGVSFDWRMGLAGGMLALGVLMLSRFDSLWAGLLGSVAVGVACPLIAYAGGRR